MDINAIIDLNNRSIPEVIKDLTVKTLDIPSWEKLKMEYNPKLHPVMNTAQYRDVIRKDGSVEHVSRITYDLQRLAVKRMNELVYGIPVKRIYDPQNDRQKEISAYIERILTRTRYNSSNIERGTMLFAGCEVMTLWYLVDVPTNEYGFNSQTKIRCRHFSPMSGDMLYPYFDEYGDLKALSVAYNRKDADETIYFFDCYTADRHVQFQRRQKESAEWETTADEQLTFGKIPAVYCYRPTPIWEDTSNIVYEMEWTMSRNGNYIRKNSKPLFGVFSDEVISFGNENENDNESRSVLQFPSGSDARYITWPQAIDSSKFHVGELRQTFFTTLQLPDWSYENMKTTPMSGEARKQLFIDCQLKVQDESGRLIEMHDREVNVIKALLKTMLPDDYGSDIDALPFECEITPYMINEDKDTIVNLMTANGNKPLMSQREAIESLGWSKDVDETIKEITEESMRDAMALAQIETAAEGGSEGEGTAE